MGRTTHTYTVATMMVSASAYDEIARLLRSAGYEHTMRHGNGIIDMNGIGLERDSTSRVAPDPVRSLNENCYVLSNGECVSPLQCIHGDGLSLAEFVKRVTEAQQASYTTLETDLASTPVTWVPGLLRVLIKHGLASTFKDPAALKKFVAECIEQKDA